VSPSLGDAWFSALGEALGADERTEIAGYLAGLGMDPAMPVHSAADWAEAGRLCRRPADAWWRAEEAERERLERGVRLNPADPEWLALTEALHGAAAKAAARAGCSDVGLIHAAAGSAAYAAHQARLAQTAGQAAEHPFLRKYALYSGGRWPLGIYDGRFAIF
jgi:hypothetical protein